MQQYVLLSTKFKVVGEKLYELLSTKFKVVGEKFVKG